MKFFRHILSNSTIPFSRYKIIIENELMESNANAQGAKGEVEMVNELSI